jgi:hypothetical protein
MVSRSGNLAIFAAIAPGLVAGEEVRRRATARLILEIDVGERLPAGEALAARRLGSVKRDSLIYRRVAKLVRGRSEFNS